jgi:hypothetical protein
MMSRNLSRRLEQVEASLLPSKREVLEVRVRASATGEVFQHFQVEIPHDWRRRGRRMEIPRRAGPGKTSSD